MNVDNFIDVLIEKYSLNIFKFINFLLKIFMNINS